MLNKIITILLNYIVTSFIIPISWVVIDYFKMKKTIKQLNIDIESLKKASTLQEKIDATNNMP